MTLRVVPSVGLPADPASPGAGWEAELRLTYECRGGRSVLADNRHVGPLVVQKSLYPEGEAVCHTVVLHPPGGIAGGDRLSIAVDAGSGSQALLTTPGATKWYKSNARPATQQVTLRAATGAIIEWLPLETIVFDGADAHSALTVELAPGAQAAGWEIVAFGRTSSGERFARGRYRQTIEIRRAGELLWAEYGEVAGGDPLLQSPVGFAGRPVAGLLWVTTTGIGEDALAACRATVAGSDARMLAGVTFLPGGILLARCLCDTAEQARRHLARLWALLRPHYAGRPAEAPRLWAT